MNADERRLAIDSITEQVIGAAHEVSNVLGVGFLEKVYENALAVAIRRRGLDVVQQQAIQIRFENVVIGDYVADLVISKLVLVEVKAVKCFDEVHLAQCLNYLKATGLQVCLLMNFGTPRVDVKRVVNKF